MQDIYGVLVDGVHIDICNTERGAKRYATMNGYDVVTVRYNCGYIAAQIAKRVNGKWVDIQ